MKKVLLFCGVLAIGFGTRPVLAAGISASAVITATADGSNWDYAITLTNSSASTDPIGTFWFAWVPGEDFMPDSPSNVVAPTGWDVNAITHGAAPDGYAIRWEASPVANALAPGSSLSGFTFTSPDSPTTLMGISTPYQTAILTSVVFQGGPFQGATETFLVQFASVPEPSTLVLGGIGLCAACAYAGFKRRRAAIA